jgi:flagellar hook-associated protein 2
VGVSSAGIGSNLDVTSIVSKLMAVESAPLDTYDAKAAALQTKQTAIASVGTALGAFQGSLTSLSSSSSFNTIVANSSNSSVLAGSATSTAVPGIYSVNVTQLAQAQTLISGGKASNTAAIGTGASTTISFQLGTVSGGTFGLEGSTLGDSVVANGISNGSLIVNGTAIATDASTTSSKTLAAAINAQSETTGVTASAGTTTTSATLFSGYGSVTTDADGSYSLSVGGVQIGTQAAGVAAGDGVTAASIDTALTGTTAVTNSLKAAGITFSGTAAGGDLQFFSADGANLTVSETVAGSVTGGIGDNGSGNANIGSSVTVSSGVTLTSSTATPILIAGSNPAAAGLTAGSGGNYLDASYAQDGGLVSGSIVIDSTNNSLTGIRDAINKASIGVTASIVSDGSANPYHLVLTSTKTGANSTMKISLAGNAGGTADSALSSLMSYDPAGTQTMSQTTAAQSTVLNVNGIPITSATNNVTGAIEGVTMTVGGVGSTSLVVSKDSSTVKSSVTAFVKAYNDLNTTIKKLTSYDADTKAAGALQGNATVLSIQTQIRRQLTANVTGLTGDLTSLSQVGISFQKDGSLTLDSTKLQTAITNNFSEIGGLFAAVGTASDSLVTFSSASAKTVPGTYALNVTALASQGALKSSAALAASTTIASDTTWSVTLNQTTPTTAKQTATVSIPAGTYTQSQLATLLQTSINSSTGFSGTGNAVNATVDADGFLTVASNRYGSTSNIAIGSLTGTAPADLFGDAAATAGVDISGTLGGVAFTGSGQTLTGMAGSATDGLKYTITGGALGERGSVSFSQGYAYQLNNLAASFVGTDGVIAGSVSSLAASIKDVQKSRETFADKLTAIETRYRTQFTALDVSISSMNTTSTFLTQQLAAIAANT